MSIYEQRQCQFAGSSSVVQPEQLRYCAAGAALAAFLLTSCSSLLTRDDYTVYRQPPEGLCEIEPLNLQQLSRSKPVTVEEAARDAAREAAAR